MTQLSSSFFGTLSVPGYSLNFGKPIPPVTKVDENGNDVVVAVEDPDHIWVSPGVSNSLDVYFESLSADSSGFVKGVYKIWLRTGVHCGKCFVLRPDGRVALRLPWDFEGKDKFSVGFHPYYPVLADRYSLVPYGDDLADTTLLDLFHGPGYLARHAFTFASPVYESRTDGMMYCFVITVTEENPKVTFPTVYSA